MHVLLAEGLLLLACLGGTSVIVQAALPGTLFVRPATQQREHEMTQCAILQAFLLRKLKIGGSMGMALKLQPILDAAQPKSKM